MKMAFFGFAGAFALLTGSALAAGATTDAATLQPGSNYAGYISGYAFPDEGSPSGEFPRSGTIVRVQPTGQRFLGLPVTSVFLFPPSDGDS